MNKSLKLTAITLAMASAIGLAGCGGGGGSTADSGGSTSNTTTTSGIITGFGSVFVDGVEFETDSSSFSLDDGEDGPENERELAVGMVVTVTGTVNKDGVTGTAKHIEYDDELEGIVNANSVNTDGTGTMTVMGQNVVVKNTTVFESSVAGITRIDQVNPGNIVEISGYSSGDGTVYATRVEVKRAAHSGEEIEVKGIISNLTATTFDLGPLTVYYNDAGLKDIPGGTLSEGLYVEVKSIDGFNASDELVASKVEREGDGDKGLDGDDGDEVDMNGVVTAVNPDSRFEIDGRTFIINDSTKIKRGNINSIDVGVYVEVEGELNSNGNLVADKVELGVEDDIEMKGNLEDANNPPGTITLFGRTIQVDATAMKIDKQDEDGKVPEHFFDLGDMNRGDFVELDVYVNPDNGELVVAKLERDDDDGDGNKLQGPVEEVPDSSTLVIAGITVDISGLGAGPFSVGEKVKVTGSYNAGTSIFEATGMDSDD